MFLRLSWFISLLLRVRRSRSLAGAKMLVALLVLFTSRPALADSISLQITNPSQTITSGATVVFMGTITNNTGIDLTASDFFFNFLNFNPVLVPNQLLGAPDFVILNNTTSASIDLFEVSTGTLSQDMPLSVDLTLEDIFNDVSAKQTITLGPSGGGKIPEPSTVVLLGAGAAIVAALRRKNRSWNNR